MKTAVITRLFDYFESHRMRDAEIARILKIARSNPGLWKKGKTKPSFDNFIDLLYLFPDIDANQIVFGESKTNNAQTATGNKNIIAGGAANINSINNLEIENKHLKQMVKEKDKQISLLEKLIK